MSIRTRSTAYACSNRLGLRWQRMVPTTTSSTSKVTTDRTRSFMDADDGKEPRDDVQRFSPANEQHPERSSDVDDEEETEGADTRRVRRSDNLAMLDDDDDSALTPEEGAQVKAFQPRC